MKKLLYRDRWEIVLLIVVSALLQNLQLRLQAITVNGLVRCGQLQHFAQVCFYQFFHGGSFLPVF